MALTRRQRHWVHPLGAARNRLIYKPTGVDLNAGTAVTKYWTVENQITDSEGHFWPPRPGDPVVNDIGGPFFTTRTYRSTESGEPIRNYQVFNWGAIIHKIYQDSGTLRETYSGPLLPMSVRSNNNWYPPISSSTDGELDELGATAIARCKPTNSVADVSVMLGEVLREGIPSLVGLSSMQSRARLAHKAGSEYLNVVFGWLPLIRDVQKIATAISRADEILSQYERDSGRNVRRQYTFPIVEKEWEEYPTGLGNTTYPAGPPAKYFSAKGQLVRKVHQSRQVKFSGCFTYFLPDGDDYRSRMREAVQKSQKLLGISLTPETLWELAPWSWFMDWFSNSGDVISNLSDWSTHGLILRYGYVMETTITTYTYTLPYHFKPGLGGNGTVTLSFGRTDKKRVAANPFGFGVRWDGLSPYQLSILGALGITRGRR